MMDVYEFYNLGIGEPMPISAANRMGLGDMLDEVIKHFPEDADTEEDDDDPENCHRRETKCRKIFSGKQTVWVKTV